MENVLLQSINLCFPKDIQEPSSEKVHQSFPYLKEVSEGLFGEKAILEAKFIFESDKSIDANDDNKSLNPIPHGLWEIRYHTGGTQCARTNI